MEMRLRSDYQLKTLPSGYETIHSSCAHTSWTHGGWLIPSVSGYKSTMADYVVPRFRSRVAAGEKFFNNMHKTRVEVVSSGTTYHNQNNAISCVATGTKGAGRGKGDLIFNLIPLQAADSSGVQIPVVSTAVSDAEITRVAKIVSTEVLAKRGTINSSLWESIAEYRQTLALLESPIRRASELANRVYRSGSRGAAGRQLLSEVSDGYLLYRYGILPIMKDIQGVLASLKKRTGTRQITSRSQEQLHAGSVSTSTVVWGTVTVDLVKQVNDVVTLRGMSLDEGYVSFANNAGLDLKGLALLPLQLTTYSFVADWFTNLSSYVGATLPAVGWKQLGSCLVTKRVVSTGYTLANGRATTGSNTTLLTPPSGSCGVIEESTTRGALYPASFEIKSDFGFDKFTRVADACALAASRFAKVSNLVGFRPNHSAFHDKKAYHRWAEQAHHRIF